MSFKFRKIRFTLWYATISPVECELCLVDSINLHHFRLLCHSLRFSLIASTTSCLLVYHTKSFKSENSNAVSEASSNISLYFSLNSSQYSIGSYWHNSIKWILMFGVGVNVLNYVIFTWSFIIAYWMPKLIFLSFCCFNLACHYFIYGFCHT